MEFQHVPGVLVLVGVFLFFLDIILIIAAFVYIRFTFDGYLKRYHRKKWEDLVLPTDFLIRSPRWGNFDRTRRMYQFRTQSIEDLGDPYICRMRKISLYLTYAWVGLFLGLLVLSFLIGIALKLLGYDILVEFFPPNKR